MNNILFLLFGFATTAVRSKGPLNLGDYTYYDEML